MSFFNTTLLAEAEESVENITNTTTNWWTVFLNWMAEKGYKIPVAILIIIISFAIINAICKSFGKRLDKKNKDKTLGRTLAYITRIVLKVLVIVCMVGYLGIDTSGIAALITSLGVAIGLAVQGALSNLAGGIMLLITRPFNVDDYIEACGVSGTVTDIHIVYTLLKTPDNKEVSIPNGSLANANITNYSRNPTRRVDFEFSISYDSDFKIAQELILEQFANHGLVLAQPEPMVRIKSHGESAIILTARCWVKNSDYWTVYFDIVESVKEVFDQNNVTIPYPQLDVHVDK